MISHLQRNAFRALFAAPLLLLAGCADDGTPSLPTAPRMAIWAEDLPLAAVPARVAFAQANHLAVNVSLVQGVHDRAYIEAVCAEAAARDVPLRFWPGLSRDLGYWPNQANVDDYVAWLDELLSIGTAACDTLEGVEVDLEMPIDRVEQLSAMRDAGATDAEISDWLLAGIDAQAFERARAMFNDAAATVRAAGLSCWATTLPMNADDYDDGDETIAKALWTPVEGVAWDAVSFQVYRSLFDAQFPSDAGVPYTSGLVTSYARSIVARWGAQAALDLGTTGTGIGVPAGLPAAADLQADIAAARAEGVAVDHIAIYSLEGLDGKPDAPEWVAVPEPAPAPIAAHDEDPRRAFRLLDLLAQ